jgi:spoIIIJ-associated protein
VKDQVFSGRDVAAAVDAAGRALGLAPQSLRYVVLDAGQAPSSAHGGSPARIAVLLDRAAAGGPPGPRVISPTARQEPRAGVRAVVRALAEAAEIDVDVQIDEEPDALVVRLSGSADEFFLEDDGAVLRAIEHLLQRMYARELHPRRLAVECGSFREMRTEALRQQALELAREVRRDGVARTTETLNAFERRLVHLALSAEEGIRTYSVGEEGERRVTVAVAEPSSTSGSSE